MREGRSIDRPSLISSHEAEFPFGNPTLSILLERRLLVVHLFEGLVKADCWPSAATATVAAIASFVFARSVVAARITAGIGA